MYDRIMTVRRIVPNFEHSEPEKARRFYENVLGLSVAMDLGWIITFRANAEAIPQITIAAEGGSGTPVPDVSVEVDDVDHVYERAVAEGCEIVYDLTDEEWGVRRFYVRDPCGRVLNVLSHR